MKTSFSRTFFPALLVLLMVLCSIGLVFQVLTKNEMEERVFDRLKKEANAVAKLSAIYHTAEIEEKEDFFLNLVVAAEVSQSDTVICDASGTLVYCWDDPMGCQHRGLKISEKYLQKALSSDYTTETGKLPGLYNDARYVVSVPIRDADGNAIGIVITSTSLQQTGSFLRDMTNIYLFSALIAGTLAILIMIWAARKHSKPLTQMKDAAVKFGHGDLTARVQVNKRHPEEIRELALAFNNMADSLEKSEYRRQEFVANVSHELKTPMTTIAGFADGILDGTIPPERQAHYLQMISQETKRLNRLVRSMLDAAKLQEDLHIPQEQKTRFDISECAGQVLLGFEQKILEKNLDVTVDFPELPVYTRAHQDHILQVIYNLTDNAVKFCPPKGNLSMKIRTGGHKIYVSVSNTGASIPQEELPLVFDRFHKLDKSRSLNRDSWGLGLYIVKTVIDAHGENISVTSRDGITEFIFTLPLVN